MKLLMICLLNVFMVFSAQARTSSEAYRGNQTVGFTVMPFAVVGPTYASQTYGGSVFLLLGANNMLSVEATKGKWYDFGGSYFYSGEYHSNDSNIDADVQSLGLHLKHFASNSFYLTVGVDYRTAEYQYEQVMGAGVDAGFKANSIAPNFRIGNQWHINHFTIGCDWFGVSVPVSHKITDETMNLTNQYEIDDYKDDKETLSDKITWNLLRFYVGGSF